MNWKMMHTECLSPCQPTNACGKGSGPIKIQKKVITILEDLPTNRTEFRLDIGNMRMINNIKNDG
jgi:hypothetical protein